LGVPKAGYPVLYVLAGDLQSSAYAATARALRFAFLHKYGPLETGKAQLQGLLRQSREFCSPAPKKIKRQSRQNQESC
jgi:hypothetical protein